jgi:hypothetical protein
LRITGIDLDCDDAGLECSELEFIRQDPTHPFDRTINRLGAKWPERIYRDDEPRSVASPPM